MKRMLSVFLVLLLSSYSVFAISEAERGSIYLLKKEGILTKDRDDFDLIEPLSTMDTISLGASLYGHFNKRLEVLYAEFNEKFVAIENEFSERPIYNDTINMLAEESVVNEFSMKNLNERYDFIASENMILKGKIVSLEKKWSSLSSNESYESLEKRVESIENGKLLQMGLFGLFAFWLGTNY